MLTTTATAMATDIADQLKLWTADIARLPITQLQLAEALARCRREIKGTGGFPPRLTLPDILERCGLAFGHDADTLDGPAAWDLVVQTAKLHAHWRDGKCILTRLVGKPNPDCGVCEGSGMTWREDRGARFVRACDCKTVTPIPELSQRVVDVVERLGGWSTFEGLSAERFPFVRRDFMAEFARWAKVEERRAVLPAGEQSRRLGGGLTRAALAIPGITD